MNDFPAGLSETTMLGLRSQSIASSNFFASKSRRLSSSTTALADAERELNIKQGTMAGVLAFVGEGVSTYDANKKSPKAK